MTDLSVLPVLDENGNLNIHNQQGFDLILGFEGLDVSGSDYWFETATGFRKELTNGDDPDQKVLEISQGELSSLLNRLSTYAITDETTTLHDLIMEGTIRVRGF